MTPGTEQRKLAAIIPPRGTDLVGSTSLEQQLGDEAGLQTIREPHAWCMDRSRKGFEFLKLTG